MRQKQLKDYIRDDLKKLMRSSKPTEHNFIHIDYGIGEGVDHLKVCKKIYALVHRRSGSFIDSIIREIKDGVCFSIGLLSGILVNV